MEEKSRFDKIINRVDSLEKRMKLLEEKISNEKELSNLFDCSRNTREGATREILENFDFATAESVLKLTGCNWDNGNPPASGKIRDLASSLLKDAWNDLDNQDFDKEGWREWNISTGCLEVWVCEGDDTHGNEIYASLKVVPVDWRVEPC